MAQKKRRKRKGSRKVPAKAAAKRAETAICTKKDEPCLLEALGKR